MLFIYSISLKGFLLFTLFITLGGIVATSISVILNSLSFWFGRVEIIANTINGLLVSFATYPDGIFKALLKYCFIQ